MIHFTDTATQKQLEAVDRKAYGLEEHEITQEMHLKGVVEDVAKSRIVNRIIHWFYDIGICKGAVEQFKDGEVEKYLRLTYGVGEKGLPGQETHPDSANDPMNAVLLARWFNSHKHSFGNYHLYDWNCEHFATFCKTSTLKVTDLDDALKEGKLTEEFLRQKSRARSTQAR